MSICKIKPVPEAYPAASLVRPPGAMSIEAFEDQCHQCGHCVDVCPAQAIGVDSNGFPYLINALACGNCGLCADVCTRGAIAFTARTRAGLKIVKAMEAVSTRW